MNTEILRKCVVELEKDAPRLQYLLGMLETLLAMTDTPKTPNVVQPTIMPTVSIPVQHKDTEAATLENNAIANLDIIKKMATS